MHIIWILINDWYHPSKLMWFSPTQPSSSISACSWWYTHSVQPTDYIIAGDINCDFRRNTGFVDRLNSYTVDNNLCVFRDKYHVDYTYLHTDQFSTSTIDHFIMTNNMYNVCNEGGIIHDVDSLSNHSAVYMNINMDNIPHGSNIQSEYSQGWFLTILDVAFEHPAPSVEHLMSP